MEGEGSAGYLIEAGSVVALPSVGDGESVVGEFVVLPVVAFGEEGCGGSDAPLEALACVTAEGDAMTETEAIEIVDELGGEGAKLWL